MRMLKNLRPSPALVVAGLALLVALAGTSVAAVSVTLPTNSVGTAQLKANAVTSAKIKNGQVKPADLSASAKTSGPRGPVGATGATGPTGPAGPAGPSGPSDGFTRALGGPVAVPAAITTLTSLNIPSAGKYVAWAKALFVTTGGAGTLTCALAAGSDNDPNQAFTGTGFPETISNVLAHEFTAAGTFDYRCQYGGTGSATANVIKIAAIKVANLTTG